MTPKEQYKLAFRYHRLMFMADVYEAADSYPASWCSCDPDAGCRCAEYAEYELQRKDDWAWEAMKIREKIDQRFIAAALPHWWIGHTFYDAWGQLHKEWREGVPDKVAFVMELARQRGFERSKLRELFDFHKWVGLKKVWHFYDDTSTYSAYTYAVKHVESLIEKQYQS